MSDRGQALPSRPATFKLLTVMGGTSATTFAALTVIYQLFFTRQLFA